jgi:triphosphoribosyl-dephospho-CoA synthetase
MRPPEVSIAGFAAAVGSLAAMVSFEEAVLSPKPGLVDPNGSGSHADMNWTTFVKGASALAPHWRDQALIGARCSYYKPLDGLAACLRAKGQEMERVMFGATDGVNTHKGLIFALSLILGAFGRCFAKQDCSTVRILATASEIISPSVLSEFEIIKLKEGRNERLTNGEKIFARCGVGGIRTEAANGFPSLILGLEALEGAIARGASLRDAALAALLVIMRECEDTNIIHRAGVDFWRGEYKEKVSATLHNFNPLKPSGYEPLLDLDRLLIARGASPGGAADLLACTLFVYRSKITDNSFENHLMGRLKV